LDEIGKILPAILKAQVQRAEPALVEVLVALWPRVVGKGIAQHTRPVAFAAGTLTLATGCPTWATQLRQMGEEIRAAVNNFLGSPIVRKLRVQHVPQMDSAELPAAQRKVPRNLEVPNLPALEAAQKLDPEISGILERSYAKYFARKKKPVH
jgi:predicted nucleic acid-binding Zn ribbon protein